MLTVSGAAGSAGEDEPKLAGKAKRRSCPLLTLARCDRILSSEGRRCCLRKLFFAQQNTDRDELEADLYVRMG